MTATTTTQSPPAETPNAETAEAEAKLRLGESLEMANLKSEQHHQESDVASIKQIAETTLSLLLQIRREVKDTTLSQELKKPHWQQIFESIKKRNLELPSPGELDSAIEGIMAILERQPPFFEGFPDSSQEQPGTRNAEHETGVALMTLMLRGHITGPLLLELLPGGIHYSPEAVKTRNNPNLEEVAHFYRQDGKSEARIILTARLFKKTTDAEGRPMSDEIEANTLQVVAHELAHAEEDTGLVYHWPDLGKLIKNPETTEPTPTLADIERQIFVRAYREPLRQQNWESPYLHELLGEFQTKGRPIKDWANLVTEMTAERRRMFFESDGTFANFLQYRLENSQFFQGYLTRIQETGPARAVPQEGFALAFHDFVTKMPVDNPKLVKLGIEQFVLNLTLPNFEGFKADFRDFLLESYVLYLRFSQLRGKDRQAKLMKNLEEGKFLPLDDDLAENLGGYESINLGKPPVQKPKEKSFWQWLGEALTEFGQAFKGMAN